MTVTQEIASFGYLAFIIFALVSPFVPIFLIWRTASLSAIFYAIGTLIEGPIHWSDQDIGWAIGTAILILLCCTIALAVVLRLAFSASRGNVTLATLAGPKTRPMKILDDFFSVSLGGLTGLLLMIALANILSGVSIRHDVDLSIVFGSGIVSVVLLLSSRARVSLVFSTALGSLSIAALIGSFQNDRILSGAETLSNGKPWCLASPSLSEQIDHIGDLGFFALEKSNSYPHLGLSILEEGRPHLAAHWSIRQQKFVRTTIGGPISACRPLVDYAIALRRGEVEKHIYAVGPHVYKIPPEFHPRVNTGRISIRSNLLVGQGSFFPHIIERIALIERPSEPHLPDDAKPLSMIPNSDELSASDLTHPNQLTVADVEGTTGQVVILNCLHGSYAHELCRVRIFERYVGYEFYLPFNQIRN
ncbi:hypothetical protein [uncultured Roseobacter sp.]|uniref:hypothetical protein n=1 Tax=uncultured Roseobacter sp. TaxID=114847 RepID=UPI002625D399|nr:hypothetical protein [uncultured Roseobacter sp.]